MPKPIINCEKCNLCGTCIDVCPVEVFEKGENCVKILNNKCIGCRACEVQCEQSAIEIKD